MNFNSIVIRIWLPLALVTITAASIAAYFFSKSQKDHLAEHKVEELMRLAQVIGIQLRQPPAMSDSAIQVRLDSASKASGALVSWYWMDRGNVPRFLYVRSAAARQSVQPSTQSLYLFVDHPILLSDVSRNYPARSTNLRLALLRKEFQESVDHIVLPVILVVLVLSFACLILFYILARWVSKPVLELNAFASALLQQDYSRRLKFRHGLREIGQLKDALNRLRTTLDQQRKRNVELTSGLEFQVAKRTQELKTVLERLNNAQLIARIGNFQYWIEADAWEMSANISDIIGPDVDAIRGLDDFLSRLSEDHRASIRQQFLTSIRNKTRVEFDSSLLQGIRPDGSWVYFIGDFGTDAASGALYLSGTIQNITARKRIEQQVNQLSLVAQLTTNGVIITDRNRVITWVNEGMTRLTGYAFEEMIGRTPRMFQSDQTSKEVRRQIAENLGDNRSVRVEVQNVNKAGGHYWIELHIEPITDARDRVIGFLAVQVDITERKRHEQELQAALQKATEGSEIKSKFVSMASHEFRTPLTTIMSGAELLTHALDQPAMPPKEKMLRYVGRITTEVVRLAGLINDVLILGRQEAGKVPFRPMETDVIQLCRELFQDREVVAGDDRMIQMSVSGEPRKIVLDPALISQVLINLANNALKYSKGRPTPQLKLEFLPKSLRMVVRDFGIGIPEEDRKHLFETFYRGANVGNIPGTGLGLSIVHQFVLLHGGEISVQSEENSGTSITLDFVYKASESHVI